MQRQARNGPTFAGLTLLRIVSWNIRSGGGKRAEQIHAQLSRWQPDIVAFNEFRGTPASQALAQQLANDGLHHQLSTVDPDALPKNALLIASRFPLEQIDLPEAPAEPTRWLLARVQSNHPLCIGAMHIPNCVTKRKFPFYDGVLRVIDSWTTTHKLGPGLMIGDTNSGEPGIDGNAAVFSKRETEWFQQVQDRGWCDLFRHLHGREIAYTWYSHKNNGYRLDQAFLNVELMERAQTMRYEWGQPLEEKKGKEIKKRRDALSDHAAMVLDLSI